ncbi:MAG: glycosyltransferase [Rhodospirillales bacterium]|nr:glycosyltransferase [Acetobacter sp.]
MKIVFLSPAAQQGGAEAVLLDILDLLRAGRPAWAIHLIAGEDGPLLSKASAMGVLCELLPFPKTVRVFGENRQHRTTPGLQTKRQPRFHKLKRLVSWLPVANQAAVYGWKLRRRLRHLQPDLVHSNGMKMHLFGALAKPKRVPQIWHLHEYLGNRSVMKTLLRWLAPHCTLVVANSESVASDVRAVLPDGPKVETIYNAVDLDVFKPDGPVFDLDQAAGLCPAATGTIRVGLVATFAFWKGHEVFLRAAARTEENVRFYVIGGPVYATAGSQRTLAELRHLAETLGICHRVGFTGFVGEAAAAMRALDVVVHASTEPEPFGLIIVQAMACERAVIVSAAGGALELVRPGVDALVHSPGNVTELANAIGKLASDTALRRRLGVAGRLHVNEQFTRRQMAARIVPRYDELLAGAQ